MDSTSNTPQARARFYYINNSNSDLNLEKYEDDASEATSAQQDAGLLHVARVLEANGIPYGVMGGYNFWTRGNSRRTEDVDVAVSLQVELDRIMDLFNNDPAIIRPRPEDRMIWIQGVARIFVTVHNDKLVQIDLKGKRAEGQGIPADLNSAVTRLPLRHLRNEQVRFFDLHALINAKFVAMQRRDADADYEDVLFICTSQNWRGQVRDVANRLDMEARLRFLNQVLENNPGQEQAVRYALQLEEEEEQDSPGEKSGKNPPGSRRRDNDDDDSGDDKKGKGKDKKKKGFLRRMLSSKSKTEASRSTTTRGGTGTGTGTTTRGVGGTSKKTKSQKRQKTGRRSWWNPFSRRGRKAKRSA